MRNWKLSSADPLALTLAADARFSPLDYNNDHIWELTLQGGEPAAIALRTTYGLRARALRIFPRFSEGEKTISAPETFAKPPLVTAIYSNFLEINFFPFEDLEVNIEYWIPDSHTISSRLSFINHTTTEREIKLELNAILAPLEGKNFQPLQMQGVNALTGKTSDLAPVLFLTGGPAHQSSPHPALTLNIQLGPGGKRRFTWAQASLAEAEDSFELARETVTRPWDAERARIELTNASQTLDIETGDANWDAAFALSQQAAFRLLFDKSEYLPHPSFVSARQPDQGYNPLQTGEHHPPNWSGQTPLKAYYLTSLLPGTPEVGAGLLRNFISVQEGNGTIDHKPGLAGQRSKVLSAPFLASLAWKLYLQNEDKTLLEETYPGLREFFWRWFAPEHDRNHDNLPEWDHLIQTGFEEHPLFSRWHEWGRGVDISTVHSPSLFAALYKEAVSLQKIAHLLGKKNDIPLLEKQCEILQEGTQACWEPRQAAYRHLDRDSNLAQRGKILHRQEGGGVIKLKVDFEKPVRILIEIHPSDKATRRPHAEINEFVTKAGNDERLLPLDFKASGSGSVATSQQIYMRIGKIVIDDVEEKDKIIIRTVDLSSDDQTLLLPLWSGMMEEQQAKTLVSRTLSNAQKFDRPFGLPACPNPPAKAAEATCLSVHLPWNLLAIEGLLRYGYRKEAARLFAHLMNAVLENLKSNHAFYQYYNAEVGTGVGERNALGGLISTGLFLRILGVQVISPTKMRLEGKNPFPWAVTVRYRGLEIKRTLQKTEITFPKGEQVEVTDEAPCLVTI